MENVVNKKIPFYKRIGYSIGKISKYPEMIEMGWTKALSYIFVLTIIFSLLISILATYNAGKYLSESYTYFEQNLPEGEFKDGVLTTNNEEKLELSNLFIKTMFGGKMILDTKVVDENVINGYTSNFGKNVGYVLLKDKILVSNLGEEGTKTYTYSEFFQKYLKNDIKEFNKQDILNYVKNQESGYLNYYMQYVPTYLISYLIVFMTYILLITAILFIISKVLKLQYKFKEIFSISSYAFTLPIIVYFIYIVQNYFTQFAFSYFEPIMAGIGAIYATMVINKKIKENKQTN